MSPETIALAQRLLDAHEAVDEDSLMCVGCAAEVPSRLVAVNLCTARNYALGVMSVVKGYVARAAAVAS